LVLQQLDGLALLIHNIDYTTEGF